MTIHWQHWQDFFSATALLLLAGQLFKSWLIGKAVDIGERLTARAEKWLVKTERDAIEWWHFRERAARADHKPKQVVDCHDGKCVEVTH